MGANGLGLLWTVREVSGSGVVPFVEVGDGEIERRRERVAWRGEKVAAEKTVGLGEKDGSG